MRLVFVENTMQCIYLPSRLALGLLACGLAAAFAQDAPASGPAFEKPLALEQLDSLRGGFDLVKNDMQLSATVTGNSAVNGVTGGNAIADGAFANSSGLPTVIQNSGSNVSIQNATIVNLQLK
jgi:hypothetical protein